MQHNGTREGLLLFDRHLFTSCYNKIAVYTNEFFFPLFSYYYYYFSHYSKISSFYSSFSRLRCRSGPMGPAGVKKKLDRKKAAYIFFLFQGGRIFLSFEVLHNSLRLLLCIGERPGVRSQPFMYICIYKCVLCV